MSPLNTSSSSANSTTQKPMVFPDYNGLQKCTWKVGDGLDNCPHHVFGRTSKSSSAGSGRVVSSALELVGRTPMIKLERIMKEFDLPCELWAKAEYFNPGGSVKDRIALRMIEAAEEEGRIRPGDTLIEPTSGNTGTGLCLAAAIKGYNMVITMPEKMSGEKVNMMKSLGAKILRTPNEAAWNTPESHIGLAIKLQKEIPRSHILDQYLNPANPMAHYEGTGAEIVDQCEGKVDVMVLGAGTGGTITGVARKLKDELGEKCLVVGVDPIGSILAVPDSLNDPGRLEGYQVEGIGYDFIPTVLDRDPSVIDEWMKVGDPEALSMARKLIRLEGLTVGGSSGTCVAAAVRYIKSQRPEEMAGKRVVALLPDSSRNYMSKFLDDGWMFAHGFITLEEHPSYSTYRKKPWGGVSLKEAGIVLSKVLMLSSALSAADGIKKIQSAAREDPSFSSEVAMLSSGEEMVTITNLYARLSAADEPKALTLEKCKHKPSPLTVGMDSSLAEVATKLDVQPCLPAVGGDDDQIAGVVDRGAFLEFLATSSA
ncbi:hypothetical protein FOZ60_002387 [Perkinsus olseni]|uniref:cystathionine beta-synthase n=3 Tax=Perkinsus olseni TaxID=32597 RepID=A0A7J6NYC1_PEROL|nr:hypothetical protein FOZ60_002387 [Perkinsus olseni]